MMTKKNNRRKSSIDTEFRSRMSFDSDGNLLTKPRRKSLVNYDTMEHKPIRNNSSSGSLLEKGDGNNGNGSLQVYSQESVLSAMDRFVSSVNNMTTCILVPSKLKDLEASSPPGPAPKVVEGSDMYQVFRMLNGLKQDFIYGPESTELEQNPLINEADDGYLNKEPSSGLTINLMERNDYNLSCSAILTRTSSDVSQDDVVDTDTEPSSSLNSYYESGSEEVADILDKTCRCPTSNKRNDSVDASTMSIANQLKYHLHGMQDILNQLSDSADYITTVYQDEIEVDKSSDPCATSEQLRFKDHHQYNNRYNGHNYRH